MARVELIETHNAVNTLVECSHFVVMKSVFAAPLRRVKPAGLMEVLIIIEGAGKINIPDAEIEYSRAQAWLVPAIVRDCRFVPATRTTMLHAHVPNGRSI